MSQLDSLIILPCLELLSVSYIVSAIVLSVDSSFTRHTCYLKKITPSSLALPLTKFLDLLLHQCSSGEEPAQMVHD